MNNKNEILNCIDNIDDVVLESQINTCNAMLNAYHKAYTILENTNENNFDNFVIVQEGFAKEVGDNMKKSGKKYSTLGKILTALPRLIISIIAAISKCIFKKPMKVDSPIPSATEVMNKRTKQEIKKTLSAIAKGYLIAGGVAVARVAKRKYQIKENINNLTKEERKRIVSDFIIINKHEGNINIYFKYGKLFECYESIKDVHKLLLKLKQGKTLTDEEIKRINGYEFETGMPSTGSEKLKLIPMTEVIDIYDNETIDIINKLKEIANTIDDLRKSIDKMEKTAKHEKDDKKQKELNKNITDIYDDWSRINVFIQKFQDGMMEFGESLQQFALFINVLESLSPSADMDKLNKDLYTTRNSEVSAAVSSFATEVKTKRASNKMNKNAAKWDTKNNKQNDQE